MAQDGSIILGNGEARIDHDSNAEQQYVTSIDVQSGGANDPCSGVLSAHKSESEEHIEHLK